jgi:hypothetical protein
MAYSLFGPKKLNNLSMLKESLDQFLKTNASKLYGVGKSRKPNILNEGFNAGSTAWARFGRART